MEAVLAALVSGLLALAGVIFTVRGSRRMTTAQHQEQTGYLLNLHQDVRDLNQRVDTIHANHETLFNLVVEIDSKVTKQPRKKAVTDSEKVYG